MVVSARVICLSLRMPRLYGRSAPSVPNEIKSLKSKERNRRRDRPDKSDRAPHLAPAIKAVRDLTRRKGALPAEKLPLILEVAPNDDYALIDSGAGRKLEQYGPYRIVRPEGQAIWQPALAARGMGERRRDLHRRHRRGRHRPLALSQEPARRDLADEA